MKTPSPLRGTVALLQSSKGVLCIAVLACMTYLGVHHDIDGTAFAAGCTVITTIFCWTRHKTDLAAMRQP